MDQKFYSNDPEDSEVIQSLETQRRYNDFFSKIKTFFKEFFANPIGKLTLPMLLLVPTLIIISYLNTIQTLETKAQTNTAIIKMFPERQTVSFGQEHSLKVYLYPNENQITNLELVISFNPEAISITNVIPGYTQAGNLQAQAVYKNINHQLGRIHYKTPLTLETPTSTAIETVTIKYKPVKSGLTNISFTTVGTVKTQIFNEKGDNILIYAKGSVITIKNASISATPVPNILSN